MLKVPQELQTITDKIEFYRQLMEEFERAMRPRPTLRVIKGGKRG